MMSFYVTVYDGFKTQEYFTWTGTKRAAMEKGIAMHRQLFPKSTGELKATARIAR